MRRESSETGPVPKNQRRVHVAILAATVSIALFLIFVCDAQWSFSGKPSVDMSIGAGLINLGLYVLIRSLNQLTHWLQFTLIGLIIACQTGLFLSFKLDGVYGNGRPKIVWKWTSKPADDFLDRSRAAPIDNVPVEKSLAPILANTESRDWPGFRGEARDGISNRSIQVGSIPKVVWRRPIGGGWSSFATSNGYCVTLEQRGDFETTVCYQAANGNQIWTSRQSARFDEVTAGEGPRSTPTIDGPRVYSFGATGILSCLGLADGELIWQKDVLQEFGLKNRIFGMAGSPLVVDDVVIVSPGGEGFCLIAFDKNSGRTAWSNGSYVSSYSSPQLLILGDKKAVLIFNGDGLTAFLVSSGEQIFHVPWVSHSVEQNNVCQPISFQSASGETRIFISSGYGQGAALFAWDQTEQKLNLVWKSKRLKAKFASAVMLGDYVYGLDEGILTCLSLKTGARVWKKGRFGHGQLIRLGETLVVQAERGYFAFVKATPSGFNQSYRGEALKSRTWNHPAVSGNLLLLRNDRNAICFRLEFNPLKSSEKE